MKKLVSFLLFFPAVVLAQVELKDQLPPWAAERWTAATGQLGVEASGRINPFLHRGDVDGDGKPDLAVLVQAKADHKVGILVLHRNGKETLLGAGRDFGNGGDDFNWIDLWWVEDRNTPQQGHPDSAHRLPCDGLWLGKEG